MIIENQKLIYTGHEKRAGKNGDYYLFKFLDETGDSFTVMLDKEVDPVAVLTRIKPLNYYNCKLSLSFGRYTNLKLLEISAINNDKNN